MLTIPSGSVTVIEGAAFVVRGFAAHLPACELYTQSASHVKLTSAKARSMARYGVPYTYKGRPLPSYEWTEFLRTLKVLTEEALGVPFNAAVVNRYATGSEGVALHSDARAIPQLGKFPVIAGVSFGATRDFVMQGLKKTSEPVVTQVNHGDLFVMHGNSQSHFKHGVPTTEAVVLPRWSVTFRFHYEQV